MKNKRKNIACLPVAGPENPYQSLMIAGLNRTDLYAFSGVDDRFLGIIRTQIRYQPDYVHFDWIVSYYYRRWSWFTLLSVLGFCLQLELIYRFTSTRIVWSLHNLLPHDLSHIFIHRFCQRFMAKRCLWIRVFSQDTISKASKELRLPTSKFHVLPEGNYTSVYPNESSFEIARRKLNLPIYAQLLLFLGSIRPYKGLGDLLQIMPLIDNSNLVLLIAGAIPDKVYAKQLAIELPPNCILHDRFIPDNELQYYFNAADAIVLPFSKVENSGSVILAMGFRKPVIAPRTGAIVKRLLHQDQLLYDSTDELKQAILKVLVYSKKQRTQIGEANFQALKKYRWDDFGTLFQ